jgi:hypothetical protein
MKSSTFYKQILAALSLATLFAGGCVSVDASVSEMQLVKSGMEFPGVPIELMGRGGEVSISQSFSYSHDPIELPEGVDSKVRPVGVSLLASRGIENFGFVRWMTITISDEVNPGIELASFERHGDDPNDDGGVLVMKVNPELDALALMKSESIGFVVDMSGSLPPMDWSMDVLIDMSGEIGFKL